jgi:hypothetical protein
MNPGEDGQLSLELFPDVDVAASRPQPEPRDSEPARAQAPPAVAASVVAPTQRHAAATALPDAPDALLTRTHLRELGLERRAVDAVFRALAVVALPGYSRPMIRVRDYLDLIENYTFRDDRVRPSRRVA